NCEQAIIEKISGRALNQTRAKLARTNAISLRFEFFFARQLFLPPQLASQSGAEPGQHRRNSKCGLAPGVRCGLRATPTICFWAGLDAARIDHGRCFVRTPSAWPREGSIVLSDTPHLWSVGARLHVAPVRIRLKRWLLAVAVSILPSAAFPQ